MVNILGIDPGKATGFAVFDTESRKALALETYEVGPQDFISIFDLLCSEHMPRYVVYERFEPRWGQKFDLDGVYLIGALQATGWSPLTGCLPSAHKALVKDSVLNPLFKEAGVKIGAGHARDALRLTLWFSATKLKHRATLDMLAGQGIKEEK